MASIESIALVQPIPTDVDGLYIRNHSQKVQDELDQLQREEFGFLVQLLEIANSDPTDEDDSNKESQQKLSNEEEEKAKEIRNEQQQKQYQIAAFLFKNTLCDINGAPFDDMQEEEQVIAKGPIFTRRVIDTYIDTMKNLGKKS